MCGRGQGVPWGIVLCSAEHTPVAAWVGLSAAVSCTATGWGAGLTRPSRTRPCPPCWLRQAKKSKRKRRPRLPKGYNAELPNGGLPLPDPERWLPKWERSDFKKKRDRRRRDKDAVKGSQVIVCGAEGGCPACCRVSMCTPCLHRRRSGMGGRRTVRPPAQNQ
jgi:hypothetical protein